LLGPP
jgi:hypothetical protein